MVRYPRRCVPTSLLARETPQKGRMATKRRHELTIHQGLSRYVHTSTSPFSLLQVPIELFGNCFVPLSIHSNIVPTLIAACSLLLLPKNETQFVQITLPTHACAYRCLDQPHETPMDQQSFTENAHATPRQQLLSPLHRLTSETGHDGHKMLAGHQGIYPEHGV